ncbi:hypothetical protein [Chondrinema litorale]|uniref:hypothetical protein n=1 Tax=Chondrinema litorale TaxID=2994555 RepID=UPI002542B444|nr:hypothetical protein [Chondrinema litorale]UZR93146.1 hypothetical protein OQ292_14900 [Chondrinema litorale]
MPSRNVDTLEAIKEYELGGKIELSEKQIALRDRYDMAFHLVYTHKQISVAARKLQEQFGISRFAAYNDIDAAMELYGNPITSRKEALRFLNTENQSRLLQLIETEIIRKRKAGQDFTAEVETASRINERIARVNRLHEDDPDTVDPTKLERTQVFIINMAPEAFNKYDEIIDIPVTEAKLPNAS